MATTTDRSGAITRFLRFTTRKEPALSVSLIAAIVLALCAKYLHLTDDDLALLGPIAVVVIGALIRLRVFSPLTHELGLADAYQEGVQDAGGQPADPVTTRGDR